MKQKENQRLVFKCSSICKSNPKTECCATRRYETMLDYYCCDFCGHNSNLDGKKNGSLKGITGFIQIEFVCISCSKKVVQPCGFLIDYEAAEAEGLKLFMQKKKPIFTRPQLQ
jgi:hypothetical protein